MIIPFPRHRFERCDDRFCMGCMICNGGLCICETCGGAEGSLPTDCPGEPLSGILLDEIMAGRIDYRRKTGWIQMLKRYRVYTKAGIFLGELYASDMMAALLQADEKWGDSVNEIREDKSTAPVRLQ